ncbi:MAG: hypothetical protein ACPH4H_08070, partial [Candidatus Poseidoniaceae archaeon]
DCINAQPKGILIWRSLTQWLGGMGIIMLGLMLLSRVLGGGMALARAELTGPSLSRLRPKLQETACALDDIHHIDCLRDNSAMVSWRNDNVRCFQSWINNHAIWWILNPRRLNCIL